MQDMFYIKDISRYVGKEVELRGWVYHRRRKGAVSFLVVRDGTGSGYIQCVFVRGELSDEQFDITDRVPLESSVLVRGSVREDKRAPGGYEILGNHIELIREARDYPITPKGHGVSFLLDRRHLWIRSKRQRAILAVRDELLRAIRDFYNQRDFVLVDTPILTATFAESDAELFETEYFNLGKVFLAQTGQLYLEAAIFAFNKVYNLGPTFRAEKSKTRRHLTEFWMNEAEMAFYDNEMNMNLQEEFVEYIVQRTLERCKSELELLERDITPIENVRRPFYRIDYGRAIELLKEKEFDIKWGDDLGGDEETAISMSFDKPVFIMNYPRGVKAFYMKLNPDDPRTVLNADLLAPEGYGEIIGGSQREDNYDRLIERISEFGLSIQPYEWYLDLRRYGSVPHAGYGIGIERTVAWICGIKHVREAIPFPRTIRRIYP
ncbi:asparagine--tRNA ligase [bacterium]|nr:MAG: asparagine--tRNA ligase [bacterium]